MQKHLFLNFKVLITSVFAFLMFGVAYKANAAKVIEFTPVGQVQLIDSIHIKFDTAIIPFGSKNNKSPVKIQCDNFDFEKHSTARWLDQNRFTYVLDKSLDAGIECSAEIHADLTSLDNQPIEGQAKFNFNSGPVAVISALPYGNYIDQDQVFALKFNGIISEQKIIDQSYCSVDGIGEQINTRLIKGTEKQEIINNLYKSFSNDPDKIHLLQCSRNLPANTDVQVVVGDYDLKYTVRDDFKATLSCQRENARKDCLPITDIDLNFSYDVDIKYLQNIKLQINDEVIMPEIDSTVSSQGYVRFKAPFPALSEIEVVLPENIQDEIGRDLINSDQFPLKFKTADYPPLVKFVSGDFGIIERFANGVDSTPSVPLTVRNVQSNLLTTNLNLSSGQVSDHVVKKDQDVIKWYARFNRLKFGNWTQTQINSILNDQEIDYRDNSKSIDTRSISVLANRSDTKTLQLPGYQETDLRPFEVIGVPVNETGLHILEVQSPRLGQSLIESGAPMYVRTMALVTNLGVHLKVGRDDLLVWVTTLDDTKPVPNAEINVLDCYGNLLAQGISDANGLLHINKNIDSNQYCSTNGLSGVFASAKITKDHPYSQGQSDYAFVFSNWNDGIESWRFNVPTDFSNNLTDISHTVLDRSLFRAGERVSMKHFVRMESRKGLENINPKDLPDTLIITHFASDNNYEIPIKWQQNNNGGLWAKSEFDIPKTAKQGNYYFYMQSTNAARHYGGNFLVQDFKLPTFTGHIQLDENASNAAIQIGYFDAGPASELETSLSALSENDWLYFSNYSDYSFNANEDVINVLEHGFKDLSSKDKPIPDRFKLALNEYSYALQSARNSNKLFIDKKGIKLDSTGGANVEIDTLPNFNKAQNLSFELSFADPNGQIQTITQNKSIWPAVVQAGIKAPSWMQRGDTAKIKAVAIDKSGNLQSNQKITIKAIQNKTYSVRKRLVGGFYSYDNYKTIVDLGQVCSGQTNSDGYLYCNYQLNNSGDIDLIAVLSDDSGNKSYASTGIWVSGGSHSWYGSNDDDRIDIIPEKTSYSPDEMARFKVLMPFDKATALVAVEREGVLQTSIQSIDRKDPTVSVQIKPEWGPNVYVSVLVLRGRVKELLWPDTTAFDWRSPKSWANTIRGLSILNSGYSNQVDLSKPSFKFGLASIKVNDKSKKLNVELKTQHNSYQVGSSVDVHIKVTKSDGSPASNGTVAFAAVDQALLDLSPNNTWDLLSAMYPTRSYGVKTSTAQMQIVGKRHYGRKALPAGGGGGKSPTRELLDTLLLWQPDIKLDKDGKAVVNLRLNDSISKFALVAIADYDLDKFGTGISYINSNIDLQIIPGIPKQVRAGDTYQAQVTLRNTTNRDMQVDLEVDTSVKDYGIKNKMLNVAAGQSNTVVWPVSLDSNNQTLELKEIIWSFKATEINSSKNDNQNRNGAVSDSNKLESKVQKDTVFDSLKITQSLNPVVPLQVQQSTSFVLDIKNPKSKLDVQIPVNALSNLDHQVLGGIDIGLSAGPIGSLDKLKDWFEYYNFFSLEYAVSKAIVLNNKELWQEIISKLPSYIDDDGLLKYYSGMSQGDEVLTAYVLSTAHDAYSLGGDFLIPQSQIDQMTQGLVNFVTGKIIRNRFAPHADLDIRKLLALDAISKYAALPLHVLDSININPDAWPSAGVIAWLSILQTVHGLEERDKHINQATNILKARMLQRGSSMVFANSTNNQSSWLMASPQSNQARLIMASKVLPQWQSSQHLLLQGLVSMQRHGSWQSTTANATAYLAIMNHKQNQSNQPIHISIENTKQDVIASLKLKDKEQSDNTFLSWSDLFTDNTQAADNKSTTKEIDTKKSDAKEDDKHVLSNKDAANITSLNFSHHGDQAWVRVSTLAAVPTTKTINSGFNINRELTPVSQKTPSKYSVGDIYKVTIEIDAQAPMSWVYLKDALPPGAMVLGSGSVHQSSILELANDDRHDYIYGQSWPAYTEVLNDSFNAVYSYISAGKTKLQYTFRLGTAGEFHLPPTKVGAIYEPDAYGELPILDTFKVSANN